MKGVIFLFVFFISFVELFTQALILKKADGTFTEISITENVEMYFYEPCPGTPTVTYESKTYNTVKIVDQCWIKENLNVGTRINSSSIQSNNETLEKYCYDDSEANCDNYGGLYQWNEAMQYSTVEGTQGICPPGWHIPTRTEYMHLQDNVDLDGNSLKSIGQGSGDGAGNNKSGFSALFAGAYVTGFIYLGSFTYIWTSTIFDADNAYEMYLNSTTNGFYQNNLNKNYSFSVRCIKDL